MACYTPAPLIPEGKLDDFGRKILLPSMKLEGDKIPVSAMSIDGVLPTGTAQLEKRGVAPMVPKWNSANCIQCNMCNIVCPHAAIRAKLIAKDDLAGAPANFGAVDTKPKASEHLYKNQVFPMDCQGCGVCIQACPMTAKAVKDEKGKVIDDSKCALTWEKLTAAEARGENENVEFFLSTPDNVLGANKATSVKGSQFLRPLFEFSGACAGCGETPYVKLASQLFGNRMVIANATGCSSIYSGTFPTIPYTKGKDGRGPAWANSLFEDNAEFGMGMRIAIDTNRLQLKQNVEKLLESAEAPAELKDLLNKAVELWDSTDAAAIANQSAVKDYLKGAIAGGCKCPTCAKVLELGDYFVDKSVWIIGGDGWAYDIGFGGLDHVLASGRNINVLVLDTEVYSNTGGQASKYTQLGAVAQFAMSGKRTGKKNLGLMAMSYGYVYTASCAMGYNRQQLIDAMVEAEAYKGPSILMCYAPCINHGLKTMMMAQDEEKAAVACGYYPVYRYNPEPGEGKPRFTWGGPAAVNGKFQDFLAGEKRFSSLKNSPAKAEAEGLYKACEEDAARRNEMYQQIGKLM